MTSGIRVLVVDNHDSFVHTLIGYLVEVGADVEMVESDAADALSRVDAADGVVISPGPGTPEDAGASIQIVRRCAATATPMLGVCLGHQALAVAFGGVVSHAADLMHGRTSPVHHDGTGVFAGLPSPFTATRYHSLAVERDRVPADLRVTAWTESGTVMGLAHRSLPLVGVQFHPESVLTEGGYLLLGTWLEGIGVMDAAARGARLSPHRTVT
ncbi:gamma-glutamyl-gamma-aminobutyrate hydrolase family protein [Microbacterium sp. KSW4-11]|uniref:Gamma-glutamyl-gamma-aminobutyrate hydrolase family protein n=1 Tax=Microbacterium gawkjiense TaxID=3067309 RepID=A0ABU3G8L1_9MICO|nr:gamma-glutamyl-gamma-aminobutyrate hydrolase family protein [Microbacterium sp. KSW4-11]MDT3316143.1 gamma-glutamyl-gamma-aminobutyrate hydrolase family protein [Microbacterium sp. KSW4-11]